MSKGCPLPVAGADTGRKVLQGLARERSLLAAMEIMHEEVGPAFQITLPGFRPAVFVGPESNRQIMVSQREYFQWRSPTDPVTHLLRKGILVTDGEMHDELRASMDPAMQKPQVVQHIPAMQQYTDRVLEDWVDGSVQDMLVEMRRVALLIFMGSLLDVEFEAEMERLWQPILRTINYISPGLWIIWPDMPRFGYGKALAQLDEYLYSIIWERRERLERREVDTGSADLLTHLVNTPGMSDDLIRDQILTMLIAGHDTSTALLSWVLHLFGEHPHILAQAQAEVDRVLGQGSITAAQMGPG